MKRTGLIYMIVNLHHVANNISPKFYIGSKQDVSVFDQYWSSSDILLEDIKRLGIHNFHKSILQEVQYETVDELLNVETVYHTSFGVSTSNDFYNLVNAQGPFYGPKTNKHGAVDTVWLNNGVKNIRANASKISTLKNKGYVEGRLPFTDENSLRDRCFVNNGTVSKSIHLHELQTFINSGWVKGRLHASSKGRKWVTDGTTNMLILPDQTIPNGWRPGKTQR